MSRPSEDTVRDREKDEGEAIVRQLRFCDPKDCGADQGSRCIVRKECAFHLKVADYIDRLRTLPEVQTEAEELADYFDMMADDWPEAKDAARLLRAARQPESEAGYVEDVLRSHGIGASFMGQSRYNALVRDLARVVPVTEDQEDTSTEGGDDTEGGETDRSQPPVDVTAGGSEEATGPSVGGIALDACPSCGSGDVAWCGISKRGHCRECDFWQSPHWGNSMEGVKAWNNHRLRPPPTASVEATPPAGPCPDCEGRRPFNCKSCGVRSVPGDAERERRLRERRKPWKASYYDPGYECAECEGRGQYCGECERRSGLDNRLSPPSALRAPTPEAAPKPISMWTEGDYRHVTYLAAETEHFPSLARRDPPEAAPEGGENEAVTFTLWRMKRPNAPWNVWPVTGPQPQILDLPDVETLAVRSLSRGTKP